LFEDDFTDEPFGDDSAPVGPNQPFPPVEDIQGADNDDIGDDWEWWIADSTIVGPQQPPRPVEDPVVFDSDDIGDDWEFTVIDSTIVGAAQPNPPVEDAWDHVDPEGDPWEDTVFDSAPVGFAQLPRPVEDPVVFDADDIGDDWEWSVFDSSVVIPNFQPPLPGLAGDNDDQWRWHEDDNTDDVVGDDSGPVGPNYVNLPSIPITDPWSFDDDHTDEPFGEDSAPVGLNPPGAPLNTPEDPWSFDDDHTDEPFGEDSAPVGLAQPKPPAEDAWQHEDDQTEEMVGEDSATTLDRFSRQTAQRTGGTGRQRIIPTTGGRTTDSTFRTRLRYPMCRSSSNADSGCPPLLKFLVIAAPRSGTAWVSNWLTTDKVECLHDPMWDTHFRDLDALEIPGKEIGVACTGLGWFPDWVNEHPAPKVILHRPKWEIDASLQKIGLPVCPRELLAGLWRIQGLHVPTYTLFDHRGASDIHMHLGLGPFDYRRWQRLKDMRVTVIPNRRRQNPDVMERLTREHRHETLA
jgi:hypothetical protein